ncbi:MAG: DUF503 family protein [Deltaproteobacteria bacterium]|nr:MAG: DUF503 family protein [Deltaproteobacteria bacterium]
MMHQAAKVYLGVLRATVVVPGARTLKQRRSVVRSLCDRIRSRFAVSLHLLPGPEHPGRQDIVVTTGGGDRSVVERSIREVQRFLETAPESHLGGLDVECFGWHPPSERDVDAYLWEGDDE